MERLKEAIEQALARAASCSIQQQAEQMARANREMSAEEFEQLVNRMVQKLAEEGYINTEQPGQQGRQGNRETVKFAGHRQVRRFPRVQDAEGFAGRAGPREFRGARHS